MKQTGLIIKYPSITDYKLGAITYELLNPEMDWKAYLPTPERQDNFTFDTMSCATFSALSIIETQMNFRIQRGLVNLDSLEALKIMGFIDEKGSFNCSDRYTAIQSGTTDRGNDFVSVWNSIRNHGLLPEKDFPMGGTKFEEYHDKSLITESMKEKALKVRDYLGFEYEWVFYGDDPSLSAYECEVAEKQIKHAPLHIGSPVPASHALMLYKLLNGREHIFDTYAPFDLGDSTRPIHFALKGVVTVKVPEVKPPRSLKMGMKGDDVKVLQADLNEVDNSGLKVDGDFGMKTKTAVVRFQLKNKLFPDGVVGPKTRAKIVEAKKKPKLTLIEALIQVESGGNDKAIGDLNLKDKAYGCLQIRQPVCDDVAKHFLPKYKAQEMLGNRELSIKMFNKYMDIYCKGYSDEWKARCWNGGPTGYKKQATVGYWNKVKKLLDK